MSFVLTDDEIEQIRGGVNPTRVVTIEGEGAFGLDYEYDQQVLCCDCARDTETWLRTIARIRESRRNNGEQTK